MAGSPIQSIRARMRPSARPANLVDAEKKGANRPTRRCPLHLRRSGNTGDTIPQSQTDIRTAWPSRKLFAARGKIRLLRPSQSEHQTPWRGDIPSQSGPTTGRASPSGCSCQRPAHSREKRTASSVARLPETPRHPRGGTSGHNPTHRKRSTPPGFPARSHAPCGPWPHPSAPLSKVAWAEEWQERSPTRQPRQHRTTPAWPPTNPTASG